MHNSVCVLVHVCLCGVCVCLYVCVVCVCVCVSHLPSGIPQRHLDQTLKDYLPIRVLEKYCAQLSSACVLVRCMRVLVRCVCLTYPLEFRSITADLDQPLKDYLPIRVSEK